MASDPCRFRKESHSVARVDAARIADHRSVGWVLCSPTMRFAPVERLRRGIILGLAALSPACRSTTPCANNALQMRLAEIREMEAALPLRTNPTDFGGKDRDPVARKAAQALLDACPGLPATLRNSVALRLGKRIRKSAPVASRWALERKTCSDYDAWSEHLRAGAHLPVPERHPEAAFEICQLHRFGLADSTRFAASEGGLSLFVLFDVVVQQGAEPTVARELVSKLFVQAPFDVDADFFDAIPRTLHGHTTSGVGVRVTRDHVLIPGATPLRHAEIASLRNLLLQHVETWARFAEDRPPLLVAADADVPARAVAELIDLALSVGFQRASLLANTGSRLGSIDLVSLPDTRTESGPTTVCVDPQSGWFDDPLLGPPQPLVPDESEGDTIMHASLPDAWSIEDRPLILLTHVDASAARLVNVLGPHAAGPRALRLLPEGLDCPAWASERNAPDSR